MPTTTCLHDVALPSCSSLTTFVSAFLASSINKGLLSNFDLNYGHCNHTMLKVLIFCVAAMFRVPARSSGRQRSAAWTEMRRSLMFCT